MTMRIWIVPQLILAAAIAALAAGCSTTAAAPTSSSTASVAPTSAAPTPTPTTAVVVLGSASNFGPSAKGFGEAQPSTIFLGGDPTGLVTDVTWSSWGAATANGMGTAVNAAHSTVASAPHEQATVVASNPQTCNGVTMYTRLVWYFPSDGGTYAKAVAQFGSQATIGKCS
jgi:hypothetical protein